MADIGHVWTGVPMIPKILKYPRTQHLSGSELQRGDRPETMPFRELKGRHIVIEEKLDGANSAVSFSEDGELLLQSRGHYLMGGPRERHFAMLKTWATSLMQDLHDILGHRYVMYGEWMYAKHTVFYDRLPHYFHEFDVYDREEGVSEHARASCPPRGTRRGERARALRGSCTVRSPPPLAGAARAVQVPHLASEPRSRRAPHGQHLDKVLAQTEDCDLSEGLYVKWEQQGVVAGRYKYVRPGFTQSLVEGDGHWQRRPILPNELAPGADLYGGGS